MLDDLNKSDQNILNFIEEEEKETELNLDPLIYELITEGKNWNIINENNKIYTYLINLFNFFNFQNKISYNYNSSYDYAEDVDYEINVINNDKDKDNDKDNNTEKNDDSSEVYNAEIDKNLNNQSNNFSNIDVLVNKIAMIIVTSFINNKYITLLPKNLFNKFFLKYIIENKYFFERENSSYYEKKAILDKLLEDTMYLKHFSIEIDYHYLESYTNYCKKLVNQLKEDLYTNIIPDIKLFNKCLSFLYLVNQLNDKNEKTLYPIDKINEKTVYLYTLLYNSLCETIHLNNESLHVYKYIENSSNSYAVKSIKNSIDKQNRDFSEKKVEMFKYNYLFKLINDDLFKIRNTINKKEKNKKYEDTNMLYTLIYSNNKVYGFDNSSYFRMLTKKAILNCFLSPDSHIHIKTKIVLEAEINTFKDCLDRLVSLFIDIEKYNSDTGYNDKSKLRSKICDILSFYDSKNIFQKIDSNTYNDFITVYISHISYVFNEICLYKIKCIKDKKTFNNPNKIYLTKNLLKFSDCLKIFKNIQKATRLPKYGKNYFSKLIEFFYNVLNSSFNSKLYSETILFQKSNISNKILSSLSSILLTENYNIIFKVLSDLSNIPEFLDTFVYNKEYHNISLFENTRNLYGECEYEDNKKLSSLLDKIDHYITNKEASAQFIKYDQELPQRYLDPLLYTEMTCPVELPGSKQFISKDTIINHLAFSKTDPFTNKNLTKEEIEEHNKSEIIKNKIKMFDEDKLAWKIIHKISN